MKPFKMTKKTVILENGLIFDPWSGEKTNGSLLYRNGVIQEIGSFEYPEDAEIINCGGRLITAAFTDIHAHFREPGREDKETLATGSDAAMAGGFTTVCVMPNTEPVMDSPESIRFIIEKARDLPINIIPIGAISKGQKGHELTEMGAMVDAGAVAVSDDGIPVQNGQMMRYALEYSQKFSIPVINHAEDIHIRNDGAMHEGLVSTRCGLPGNPGIAESVMIYRDLELAEYTGGRLHIPHVTTRKSVDLIRQFKDRGAAVTAEATPHHLGLTDSVLLTYDTNAKVAPPLRTEDDRLALIDGLKTGVIDCIATDHAPHTIEEKEADFLTAPCGMIGLESAFGLTHGVLTGAGMTTEDVIRLLTVNPRRIFGMKDTPVQVNAQTDLVVIDPDESWVFTAGHICSRSRNTPMIGKTFKGRVRLTLTQDYIWKASES